MKPQQNIKSSAATLNAADYKKISLLLHNILGIQLTPIHKRLDKVDGRLDKVDGILNKLSSDVYSIQNRMTTKEELKQYTQEGIETIMAELEKIEDKLVEKEEIDKLKIWAAKVSQKVGVAY